MDGGIGLASAIAREVPVLDRRRGGGQGGMGVGGGSVCRGARHLGGAALLQPESDGVWGGLER